MLEFTVTAFGERIAVALPDASAIPVPSVAKAAVAAHEASAELHEARRIRDAAMPAIEEAKAEVKRQAAELAIKKKDLPKDIRRAIKFAEEALADAEVVVDAREAAMQHAYAALVAEVNANRMALERAGIEAAAAALKRMAAASEAFTAATIAAHAGYGLLGMFRANDEQGRGLLKYRDPRGSKRTFYVTEALDALRKAVGHSSLELEAYKRGEVPTIREIDAADRGEE